MSTSTPPPLPKRAIKTAARSMSGIDKAFALATPEPFSLIEADSRNSFGQWDETGDAKPADVDAAIVQMRRAHLQKVVKATMAGSLLILVVGLLRLAIFGSGSQEEEIARATFAKMREVPAEIAALPRTLSTLNARTQLALKIEHRRETMKLKTASSRSNAFW